MKDLQRIQSGKSLYMTLDTSGERDSLDLGVDPLVQVPGYKQGEKGRSEIYGCRPPHQIINA